MGLILHQALKDVRAERWLVAAWAAVMLTIAAIETLKLDAYLAAPDAVHTRATPVVLFLVALTLARPILGWLLAVRIVHEDPPDDTSAFWLTRPLSPGMLLAAKLGLLSFLLLVVPGLVAAVVFLANDVAPALVPGFVLQWLLLEAVLLLPFILLATLTRDLARIVLAIIVGIVAWAVLQSVVSIAYDVNMRFPSPWAYRTVALTWTGFGLALVAVCAALVVWQYRTRRTAATAWATLIAVLGLATVAALPSVALLPDIDRSESHARNQWDGARGVTVAILPDTLRERPFRSPAVGVIGDLAVVGGEKGILLDIVEGHGTLRLPNRAAAIEEPDVDRFNFDPVFRMALGDEAGRRTFERAIGARLVLAAPPNWNALNLVQLRPNDYREFQGMSGTYEADLVMAAYRVAVSRAIQLRPGLASGVDSVGITLLSSSLIRDGRSFWGFDLREAVPRALVPPAVAQIGYVLRNRRLGEARLLVARARHLSARGLTSTFLTVTDVSAALDPAVSDLQPSDRAWLADAELLVVSFELLGTFDKHVVVPTFRLPEVFVNGRR
jgi:ABC-type transport system involved in multi-copper enzyme maturation permease subunit